LRTLLLLLLLLQKESGNVIVFLGNESPLGIPKQPIVFENARRLNALVVLVEHRYYGGWQGRFHVREVERGSLV
jgi:hypothetical protein